MSSSVGYQDSVGVSSGGGCSSLGSITLKIILSREEVEYLFGFDGTLINQLRSQSGANINLTDGDSLERVLMINGSLELIFKAFSLITRKLWDFISSLKGPQNLVIRLAVPASQCGSIIGKQGAKVKEIRDLTGANIQVSQESLGDSTERAVEISGSGEACLQCAYHVCTVLEETPLRGEIIPYVPSLLPRSRDWQPVFLCGDKAYVIDGDIARLASPEQLQKELGKTAMGPVGAENAAYHNSGGRPSDGGPNPLALMASVNSRNHKDSTPVINREMTIEAEYMGSLIGKGGSKIAEIRRMSGATIMVNEDGGDGIRDSHPGSSTQRVVSLSGSEDSVLLAEFLIQSTLDAAVREHLDYGPGQVDPQGGHSSQQPSQHHNQHNHHFGNNNSNNGMMLDHQQSYHQQGHTQQQHYNNQYNNHSYHQQNNNHHHSYQQQNDLHEDHRGSNRGHGPDSRSKAGGYSRGGFHHQHNSNGNNHHRGMNNSNNHHNSGNGRNHHRDRMSRRSPGEVGERGGRPNRGGGRRGRR